MYIFGLQGVADIIYNSVTCTVLPLVDTYSFLLCTSSSSCRPGGELSSSVHSGRASNDRRHSVHSLPAVTTSPGDFKAKFLPKFFSHDGHLQYDTQKGDFPCFLSYHDPVPHLYPKTAYVHPSLDDLANSAANHHRINHFCAA